MLEAQPTRHHLPELLRRLDDGWRIEEPLLQRSVSHGLHGRSTVLEVVICKEGQRRAIALADGAEVQQFLRQRRLRVFEV